MRIPIQPPTIEFTAELGKKLEREDVRAFIQEANERYLHWDRLRRKKLPEGMTAEEVWAAVKISRSAHLRKVSFGSGSPTMNYWIPNQLQEWLHTIDVSAGGQIGASQSDAMLQDNDQYLINSLMEEAIASSQLEGAATTRRVAKDMLRKRRRPANKHERMIVNNYEAILEIRELKDEDLSPELLCNLQDILTKGTMKQSTDGGRFRTADEDVAVIDEFEEVIYEPPRDGIDELVDQICRFANRKHVPFMHPVVQASILHFLIGFVHPFVDGNGRTARAISYWFMLKHGYWLFEYLPISKVIIKAPAQYARAYLYSENDSGDITYFLHYSLKAAIQSINNLHEYIQVQQEKQRQSTEISSLFPHLNYRQVALLRELIELPTGSQTVRGQQIQFAVSYASARNDLAELVKLGLLVVQQLDKKQKVFKPADNFKERIQGEPRSL